MNCTWKDKQNERQDIQKRIQCQKGWGNTGGGKGPLLRDVEEKNRDSLDEYIWVVESREQQDREYRAEEQNRGKREVKPQDVEEHRAVKWKNEMEVVGQKFPGHYMWNYNAVQQVCAIFPGKILIPQSCCVRNWRQLQTKKHRSALS